MTASCAERMVFGWLSAWRSVERVAADLTNPRLSAQPSILLLAIGEFWIAFVS